MTSIGEEAGWEDVQMITLSGCWNCKDDEPNTHEHLTENPAPKLWVVTKL